MTWNTDIILCRLSTCRYRIIPNRYTRCLDKSTGGGYIRTKEPGATVTNMIYKRNRPPKLGEASIRGVPLLGIIRYVIQVRLKTINTSITLVCKIHLLLLIYCKYSNSYFNKDNFIEICLGSDSFKKKRVLPVLYSIQKKSFCITWLIVPLTSVGVSEYSLTRSTATMLVSNSLVILTIQFNVWVIYTNHMKINIHIIITGELRP